MVDLPGWSHLYSKQKMPSHFVSESSGLARFKATDKLEAHTCENLIQFLKLVICITGTVLS